MKVQELVRKINSYMMAGEIQQEFPFEADFAGLPEDDRDVLILTSGRLRFSEYVTRNDDGQWELLLGADSNISVNGHDPQTMEVLTEDEADAIWIVLRDKVEEILEEVQ